MGLGWSTNLNQLNLIQDAAFTSWTNGLEGTGPNICFGGLSWGFGYLGQPHLLTRFMAMPNTEEVKKGMVVAFVGLFQLWRCINRLDS